MTADHPLRGRKQSPEHVAKRARKCEPGCTCKKHTSWERGVEAAKAGVARAKEAGVYKESAQKGQATRAEWTEEQKAENARKISEGQKANWAKAKAEGRRRNRHYGTRKRTSQHELALVPYMAALGYAHDTGKTIGRKVPDFVNEGTKSVIEYFGTYWHPDRDEERRVKEFYAQRGWKCYVLWEDDLFDWLQARAHLVTDEQHAHAWRVAHVNNGFAKPVS